MTKRVTLHRWGDRWQGGERHMYRRSAAGGQTAPLRTSWQDALLALVLLVLLAVRHQRCWAATSADGCATVRQPLFALHRRPLAPKTHFAALAHATTRGADSTSPRHSTDCDAMPTQRLPAVSISCDWRFVAPLGRVNTEAAAHGARVSAPSPAAKHRSGAEMRRSRCSFSAYRKSWQYAGFAPWFGSRMMRAPATAPSPPHVSFCGDGDGPGCLG